MASCCWPRNSQRDSSATDIMPSPDQHQSSCVVVQTLQQENESLKCEVERLQKKLQQLSMPTLPPHVVDERFRGRVNSMGVSQKVCTYFGGNGQYVKLEEEVYRTPESDDLKSLMVPISQLCYESAKNVSTELASKELEQLFTYHKEFTDDQCDALVDMQHAYGLLLHHRKKGQLHHTLVKKEFERLLNDEKNSQHKFLHDKITQRSLLDKIIKESIEQSIQMVSISPPMIIASDQSLERNPNAVEIVRKNNCSPSNSRLFWTQPVLFANWCGEVRERGRADDRDCDKCLETEVGDLINI